MLLVGEAASLMRLVCVSLILSGFVGLKVVTSR
jgi:hypothetical protein